MHAEFEGLKQR